MDSAMQNYASNGNAMEEADGTGRQLDYLAWLASSATNIQSEAAAQYQGASVVTNGSSEPNAGMPIIVMSPTNTRKKHWGDNTASGEILRTTISSGTTSAGDARGSNVVDGIGATLSTIPTSEALSTIQSSGAHTSISATTIANNMGAIGGASVQGSYPVIGTGSRASTFSSSYKPLPVRTRAGSSAAEPTTPPSPRSGKLAGAAARFYPQPPAEQAPRPESSDARLAARAAAAANAAALDAPDPVSGAGSSATGPGSSSAVPTSAPTSMSALVSTTSTVNRSTPGGMSSFEIGSQMLPVPPTLRHGDGSATTGNNNVDHAVQEPAAAEVSAGNAGLASEAVIPCGAGSISISNAVAGAVASGARDSLKEISAASNGSGNLVLASGANRSSSQPRSLASNVVELQQQQRPPQPQQRPAAQAPPSQPQFKEPRRFPQKGLAMIEQQPGSAGIASLNSTASQDLVHTAATAAAAASDELFSSGSINSGPLSGSGSALAQQSKSHKSSKLKQMFKSFKAKVSKIGSSGKMVPMSSPALTASGARMASGGDALSSGGTLRDSGPHAGSAQHHQQQHHQQHDSNHHVANLCTTGSTESGGSGRGAPHTGRRHHTGPLGVGTLRKGSASSATTSGGHHHQLLQVQQQEQALSMLRSSLDSDWDEMGGCDLEQQQLTATNLGTHMLLEAHQLARASPGPGTRRAGLAKLSNRPSPSPGNAPSAAAASASASVAATEARAGQAQKDTAAAGAAGTQAASTPSSAQGPAAAAAPAPAASASTQPPSDSGAGSSRNPGPSYARVASTQNVSVSLTERVRMIQEQVNALTDEELMAPRSGLLAGRVSVASHMQASSSATPLPTFQTRGAASGAFLSPQPAHHHHHLQHLNMHHPVSSGNLLQGAQVAGYYMQQRAALQPMQRAYVGHLRRRASPASTPALFMGMPPNIPPNLPLNTGDPHLGAIGPTSVLGASMFGGSSTVGGPMSRSTTQQHAVLDSGGGAPAGLGYPVSMMRPTNTPASNTTVAATTSSSFGYATTTGASQVPRTVSNATVDVSALLLDGLMSTGASSQQQLQLLQQQQQQQLYQHPLQQQPSQSLQRSPLLQQQPLAMQHHAPFLPPPLPPSPPQQQQLAEQQRQQQQQYYLHQQQQQQQFLAATAAPLEKLQLAGEHSLLDTGSGYGGTFGVILSRDTSSSFLGPTRTITPHSNSQATASGSTVRDASGAVLVNASTAGSASQQHTQLPQPSPSPPPPPQQQPQGTPAADKPARPASQARFNIATALSQFTKEQQQPASPQPSSQQLPQPPMLQLMQLQQQQQSGLLLHGRFVPDGSNVLGIHTSAGRKRSGPTSTMQIDSAVYGRMPQQDNQAVMNGPSANSNSFLGHAVIVNNGSLVHSGSNVVSGSNAHASHSTHASHSDNPDLDGSALMAAGATAGGSSGSSNLASPAGMVPYGAVPAIAGPAGMAPGAPLAAPPEAIHDSFADIHIQSASDGSNSGSNPQAPARRMSMRRQSSAEMLRIQALTTNSFKRMGSQLPAAANESAYSNNGQLPGSQPSPVSVYAMLGQPNQASAVAAPMAASPQVAEPQRASSAAGSGMQGQIGGQPNGATMMMMQQPAAGAKPAVQAPAAPASAAPSEAALERPMSFAALLRPPNAMASPVQSMAAMFPPSSTTSLSPQLWFNPSMAEAMGSAAGSEGGPKSSLSVSVAQWIGPRLSSARASTAAGSARVSTAAGNNSRLSVAAGDNAPAGSLKSAAAAAAAMGAAARVGAPAAASTDTSAAAAAVAPADGAAAAAAPQAMAMAHAKSAPQALPARGTPMLGILASELEQRAIREGGSPIVGSLNSKGLYSSVSTTPLWTSGDWQHDTSGSLPVGLVQAGGSNTSILSTQDNSTLKQQAAAGGSTASAQSASTTSTSLRSASPAGGTTGFSAHASASTLVYRRTKQQKPEVLPGGPVAPALNAGVADLGHAAAPAPTADPAAQQDAPALDAASAAAPATAAATAPAAAEPGPSSQAQSQPAPAPPGWQLLLCDEQGRPLPSDVSIASAIEAMAASGQRLMLQAVNVSSSGGRIVLPVTGGVVQQENRRLGADVVLLVAGGLVLLLNLIIVIYVLLMLRMVVAKLAG